MEIYNDEISDLLLPPKNLKSQLKMKVQDLIETSADSREAVLELMLQGNKKRHVGAANMNERSSRSHTIFRINVKSVLRLEDGQDTPALVSQINLGN